MATMTDSMFNFIQEWESLGGPIVRKYGLPVSAMLACASVESHWGKGKIFLATLNPFSLQKWPHVPFPRTHQILWRTTLVQTSPPIWKKAPFVCSVGHEDAARQWCEWILHYGEADGPPGNQDPKAPRVSIASAIARRTKLLGLRNNPVEFARQLPLVGFGENSASGQLYARRLSDFSLQSIQ